MYLHEVVKESVPFKHPDMIGAYVCYGNYIYHCDSEQDCYNTIFLNEYHSHTIYFPWMDRESVTRNDWFNVKEEE